MYKVFSTSTIFHKNVFKVKYLVKKYLVMATLHTSHSNKTRIRCHVHKLVLIDFIIYINIHKIYLNHCRESDYLATQLRNQVREIKVIIKIIKI